MKASCLVIHKGSAERIRRSLMQSGLLDNRYRLKRIGNSIAIPIKTEHKGIASYLKEHGLSVQEVELESSIKRPSSYKDLIDLPDGIKSQLPGSFDVIGEIAIIRIEDEMIEHKEIVADALLSFNKNLKTVALDKGVKGEFRIRDLETIKGDSDMETVHVENNLRFKLDPSKVYFSPRLATERMRIAEDTGKEKVLDMFAGVGPFALTIARHSDAKNIVGIDLNPDCVNYFIKNISLNSASDTTEAYLGDASEISITFAPFDRIIMNLPHSSMDHLGYSMDLVDKGYIHLYSIVDDDKVMERIKEIIYKAEEVKKKVSISDTRVVHNYSPSSSLMVFDIQVL